MKFFFDKKILYVLLAFIICVGVTTQSIFIWYLEKVTPKINQIVVAKLEKITYEIITDKINTDLINENNLKDIIHITKNNEGEILTVDYNLEKAYSVNNTINNSIRNSLNHLETGALQNSEFLVGDNSIYIHEPLFVASDYALLSNFGPKIPIKISFIGTIVTNLETRITSYGLNNVLNEIYVKVEISELITTPTTSHTIKLEYDILIDATMINGRVPSFYGGEITTESNILDIPLE